MISLRLVFRGVQPALRPALRVSRAMSTSIPRMASDSKPKSNSNVDAYRETQTSKATGPHMTNTNSTIANNMPNSGTHNVPPEFISSVDSEFQPKDSIPENTERMTGETQDGHGKQAATATEGELGVGEMEESEITIAPLKRSGEHADTMRARLQCKLQSRHLPTISERYVSISED
jgi:hypothetical protein